MNVTLNGLRGTLLFTGALSIAGCSSTLSRPSSASSAPASECADACLAGLDPYDAGCAADAVTVSRASAIDETGREVAVVEIRRSARCRTSWARAVRSGDARGALVAAIRAQGFASAFEHATDGEVWTDMVPAARDCATAIGGVRGAVVVDAHTTTCASARVAGAR